MMKISVVTPSYNQGKYIEQNILSVEHQNCREKEHVVVDGGSSDRTLEILKRYSDRLRWLSEGDEGQADALNKGLRLTTGDIIGWINSDDYYEHNVFKDVMRRFEDENVQWVIGNVSIVYEQIGKTVAKKSPVITYQELLMNPDILCQQATFFRRSFLERVGAWNKQYHLAMDYDLWVRMSKISEPKMVDRNWAYFRMQPEQKTSARTLLRQMEEIDEILRRENASWIDRKRIVARKYYYLVKHSIKLKLISLGLIGEAYKNIPFSARKQ